MKLLSLVIFVISFSYQCEYAVASEIDKEEQASKQAFDDSLMYNVTFNWGNLLLSFSEEYKVTVIIDISSFFLGIARVLRGERASPTCHVEVDYFNIF